MILENCITKHKDDKDCLKKSLSLLSKLDFNHIDDIN